MREQPGDQDAGAAAEQPPDAEALRQRLYLPGASDQDLAAYRSATATAAARSSSPGPDEEEGVRIPADVVDAGPLPGDPGVPARRSPALITRRRVLGAAVVAVATGVAGAVALQLREDPAPRQVPPTALRLDGVDRAELLANLGRGGAAGISAYLVTHRSPRGLAGSADYITVEHDGTGRRTVPLAAEGVGGGPGRATVLVVTADSGPVSWTMLRLATAGSPVVRLSPVASRGGDQTAGDLTAATVAYAAGRRPVRLTVDVPDGVRWGAAVVFSD